MADAYPLVGVRVEGQLSLHIRLVIGFVPEVHRVLVQGTEACLLHTTAGTLHLKDCTQRA